MFVALIRIYLIAPQVWDAFSSHFGESWKQVQRDIAKRTFELIQEQKELMRADTKIKKV